MPNRSLSSLIRTAALLLPAALLMSACAGTRPRLEGAWECVQPAPAPGRAPVVKVLADGHFSFGAKSPDGQPLWAGGGTYAYGPEPGTYSETVTYHWARALVGQVITFASEVDGDLWRHRASFTAGGEEFRIDEVWRRIRVPEGGR